METALNLLHIACAVALLAAHCAFLFRGLAIESGRIRPGRLDHLARSLSQALLPVAALSGLILRWTGGGPAGRPSLSLSHLIFGLAPLAAIPLVFFARVLLKKRRQVPWLLPVLNLILLAAALGTGILLWR